LIAKPELKAPLKAAPTWPDCVSGSGFPNGDAPSPCGIPDDDDRGRLHTPVP
jgi:hypothetical protein